MTLIEIHKHMDDESAQADGGQIEENTCRSSVFYGYFMEKYLCYRIIRGNVKHICLSLGGNIDTKGNEAEGS